MLPKLRDRLFGIQRERYPIAADAKSAVVPFTEPGYITDDRFGYLTHLSPVTWIDTSWGNLVDQIYLINAAVFQCISTLAFGYNEPPPIVKVNGDVEPTHALQALLNRPNPLMSHAELMQISIVYRAIGGNCYLHKVRNKGGQVVELWPYHAGQMWPVPSRFGWVEEYEYQISDGRRRRIPASEIIHLKWPAVDLHAPYLAMSPLVVIAREVMTDTEATRFLYAVLKNDATPRGIVTTPPSTPVPPKVQDKIRSDFYATHGGDNRGGLAFLENGAKYERISLNMHELAFDALRRVPEARIAGAFRVPPIVAGLSVGLEHSTYANYEQAVAQMTRGTFVPMWRSDAVELTQALQGEYADKPVVAYETGKVAALQEAENEKFARAGDAFVKNGPVLDEFRAMIGLPPIDQVIPGDVRGTAFNYELTAVQPAQKRIIDAIVEPQQIAQEAE